MGSQIGIIVGYSDYEREAQKNFFYHGVGGDKFHHEGAQQFWDGACVRGVHTHPHPMHDNPGVRCDCKSLKNG